LQHKRELKELQQETLLGKHDLCYFDEAGFSLTPSVPYAWQPIGERLEIPSSKSKQLNVLGFLNYNGQHLDPYVVQGRVDSSTAIACFDSFSNKIKKPTTVVIDNAPIHTSALFQSMIPQWEKRDLFLWFLPAYCPELNLIEMLWKKIKYQWMPISAYQSFENLDKELISILAAFGNKFQINFSK
jgi:hypothetical protein